MQHALIYNNRNNLNVHFFFQDRAHKTIINKINHVFLFQIIICTYLFVNFICKIKQYLLE